MGKIAVQVVEDHPAIHMAIQFALPSSHYYISAISESVPHALEAAKTQKIDMVVLDLGLPGLSGESLLKIYTKLRPRVPVLIYSATSNLEIPARCLYAGARGFVRKSSPVHEFLTAVNTVALKQERYVPSCLKGVLCELKCHEGRDVFRLTDREQQVVRLVALGNSNRQMASKLGISERTVNIHRSNMMRKLDAHKCSEVTCYAISSGIVGKEEIVAGK